MFRPLCELVKNWALLRPRLDEAAAQRDADPTDELAQRRYDVAAKALQPAIDDLVEAMQAADAIAVRREAS